MTEGTYTLPERRATVEFEEYPGLEVSVRLSPVPMAAFLDISEMFEDKDNHTIAGLRKLAEQFLPIAGLQWNLPEPATLDGLLAQPLELALAIISQWTGGVAEVPLPLSRLSSDGSTSKARPASKSRKR